MTAAGLTIGTLNNCTLTDNDAARSGGGAYDGTLNNCTLTRNSARYGGGASGGTLNNCTLTGNQALGTFGSGGGAEGSTLNNCIIAGNSATSGIDVIGTLNSLDYNLIQDTNGATITGVITHNIYNQDPKLGPLADYGGPTPTMPLLAGSPAIDAGGTTDCLPTDQRGRIRPYGAACDIGAFESSPPYVIRGTLSGFTLNEPLTLLTSPGNPLAANRGPYSFDGLSPNTYTVTPSNANYHIIPSNRVVTVGPDEVNADFKAFRWNSLSVEGISNGVLHLMYAGTNGDSVRTLASSNLMDWNAISTNTVPSTNLFDVFDTTSQPWRFYRTAMP